MGYKTSFSTAGMTGGRFDLLPDAGPNPEVTIVRGVNPFFGASGKRYAQGKFYELAAVHAAISAREGKVREATREEIATLRRCVHCAELT